MKYKIYSDKKNHSFCSLDGIFYGVPNNMLSHIEYDFLQFDEDKSIKILDSKISDLTVEEITSIESVLSSIDIPENFVSFSHFYEKTFLFATDWLIMRHIREKDLNIETTLSEDDYLALQNERQLKSKRI